MPAYRIASICNERGIEHPMIVERIRSRDRRAPQRTDLRRAGPIRAGRIPGRQRGSSGARDRDVPQPVRDLADAWRTVNPRRLVECYHDAVAARDQALQMFKLGLLSLTHRGLAERLYWSTCTKVRDAARKLDKIPEELEELEGILSDTYFCNFSIFQSLPDSWAIDQLFPIMPIHRLDEQPVRKAVLADITCDSDGKIDHFVDLRDSKRTLEVHPLRENEDYFLAAFPGGRRIRKRSATCTTCSVTRTWCTSACMTRAAGGSRRSSRATPPTRCWNTWNMTSRSCTPALRARLRARGAGRTG